VRVAGIDCGTNSVRLLVADLAGGELRDVAREMRIVRLGQDVDRTGRLAPESLARTRTALLEYAELIAGHGARRVRMVATSATRDARNREAFTAMVREVLGIDPEVVSGAEEAELSYRGAVAGLPAAAAPLLVTDIGGGSTELVLGGGPGTALRAVSMDVGSVRMTERHLHDDPPTTAQVAAAVRDVEAALDEAAAHVGLDKAATVVGVAGTVTTVAAIALGLQSYDADAIQGYELAAATVHAVTGRLLGMSRAERSAVPVIHPGRVDVIGGGALILRAVLERTGASSVTVSEHDILDGVALSLA
jgi:exopolyphosphatase/guanosine-5'-triphosphate,3'-diphosphate pyrophosphatase